MSTPTFSIIAPIYNEFDNLPELYRRVTGVMDGMCQPTGESWELVLVDDGSRDGSTERIRELAGKDERVRPVIFARNFGHQLAVTAGLDYARGQAAVIIDADLQDPPEVIVEMVAKWREGYEVVYATRTEREGESWFKLVTADMFYRLIYRITDISIPRDTGMLPLPDPNDTRKGKVNSMYAHYKRIGLGTREDALDRMREAIAYALDIEIDYVIYRLPFKEGFFPYEKKGERNP